MNEGIVSPALLVRPAVAQDGAAMAAIYNPYITGSTATFEEEPVSEAEMCSRWKAVQAQKLPWLVASEGEVVLGYAYATRWRLRSAYRFSVEISAYVASDHRRGGVGAALYGELFSRLQALGVHAVMSGITLPNEASVTFHEKFAMAKVAHFERVGFKFDRWLDVGYWQRLLPMDEA